MKLVGKCECGAEVECDKADAQLFLEGDDHYYEFKCRLCGHGVKVTRVKVKPHRYTSAAEIEEDIKKCHKKIKRLEKQAQAELDAEELYKGTDNIEDLRKHREKADELLGKITRMKNTRLKRLGKTLAEFQTIPLPVEGLSNLEVVLNRVE